MQVFMASGVLSVPQCFYILQGLEGSILNNIFFRRQCLLNSIECISCWAKTPQSVWMAQGSLLMNCLSSVENKYENKWRIIWFKFLDRVIQDYRLNNPLKCNIFLSNTSRLLKKCKRSLSSQCFLIDWVILQTGSWKTSAS